MTATRGAAYLGHPGEAGSGAGRFGPVWSTCNPLFHGRHGALRKKDDVL